MSILVGIWRPQGPPVARMEVESMTAPTQRFAPDGEWFQCGEKIGLGFQAQYTHERSRLEVQPASDVLGNLLVYDGRLDNFRELLADLNLAGEEKADSEIILSAYRQWGDKCFARLIGDWALVLWDSRTQRLYLARDHAGTRLLHYYRDPMGTVSWATYLDSYVGTPLLGSLDPVYIASYLAMLPCYGRSPYEGVRSVLPGQLLTITQRGIVHTQFWRPDPRERYTCRSDGECEAQFLYLLKQSIARRTGPGSPILAQLSGGIDSTSIVCVTDRLQNVSDPAVRPLQTLSYFNDSDPSWNERPYFTVVEAKRGRSGFHVDASIYENSYERPYGNEFLYLYPGIGEGNIRHDNELHSMVSSGGYRSILSGIGGDEFTGGNPNPAAEVADLLAAGKIVSGMRQGVNWGLARRIALIDLLSQSASFLRSHSGQNQFESAIPAIPWLTSKTLR